MTHPVDEVDVAVIGFGPSGAVCAGLLGREGLRTLAIDRSRAVYDKPRAMAIDHEILRLFDNLGVADRVLPHVAPFTASEHFGAQGQLIRRIDMVPPPYPLGYTPSMVFTQPPVEAALRHHVTRYDSVTVALGTELVGLVQSADRVTLHLHEDDGRTRTTSARYVVACDGAASSVRQMLGIALDDLVFDEPWLVVDLLVGDAARARLPQNAAQFCEPARPMTYLLGPGDHRRWEIMLLSGEDPREMATPERVWPLLARWLAPAEATLWRAATYRFHALVAREWRRGRVFLAGDAAHQQPPFIGQGMCQGLRDVSNLTWKLVGVLAGRYGDGVLDTYGEERGAHVRELTTRIKAIGHVICERDPDRARLRDARILAEGGGAPRTITRQEIVPPLQAGLLAPAPHPARGTLFPQPRVQTAHGPHLLDSAHGAGWRLILDGRCEPALSQATRRMADRLGCRILPIAPTDEESGSIVETEGVVAAWFDRHGSFAAIVRPDHYVFGVAADAATLDALLARLASCLRPASVSSVENEGAGEPALQGMEMSVGRHE